MISASLLLLAGLAAAKTCTDVTIPVNVTSFVAIFDKQPLEENLDVNAWTVEFTKAGQNYSDILLQRYETLHKQYQISATYCSPDGGAKSSVVQLLTHGIGFDKTYWDLSFNNYNYSYVETAVQEGYSTLAIDRLGIGNSSHGDPWNEIQTQVEVEAINAVTTKLRLGQIPGINHRFEKVIHVGHSMGSAESYWLSALYPNNTDGLILTGWSANGSATPLIAWNLHSARLNQPFRLGNCSDKVISKTLQPYVKGDALLRGVQTLLHNQGVDLTNQELWNEIATTEVTNLITGFNTTDTPLDYPPGYVVWADLTANQFVFLLRGFYDPELAVITEATKHPLTVGEFLTIGAQPRSSAFNGPVLVLTGEQDAAFCGGNCYASQPDKPNTLEYARRLFPNIPKDSKKFQAIVHPNTGHSINVHYNATAAYDLVQRFLETHGLGA